MNDDSRIEINNFLKKFPKSDVVSELKEIDLKIDSLHKISSKDFLYFNKMLKEYHQKIKVISELNGKFNVHLSKEIPELLISLKDESQIQKDFVLNINKGVQKLSELFSMAFSNFSLTIVPFKNYKQNLITLKYVLANLKLHISYVNLSNKQEFKDHLNVLNDRLDEAIVKVDGVSKEIELFSRELLAIKEVSNSINSENSIAICDQILNLNKGINRMSLEDYWPNELVMNINSHTQMCFSSMGEVITNLQYHDIIRQKMEHIQESQQALIKGINGLDNFSDNSDEYAQVLGFLIRIPEVTSVQVAQLLYTNKDYQTSLEKISNKLLEVSQEMKRLHELYSSANKNANKFNENFLSDIGFLQEDYNKFFKQIKSAWIDVESPTEKIFSEYSVLKKALQETFDQEKEIRTEIRFLEKLIKDNGKEFGLELVKKLSHISSDLQLNSNSLKNHFNGVTQQVNSSSIVFGDLNKAFLKANRDSATLNELLNELNEVKNKAAKQSENSLAVSEEISSSLHKVEYYTYFKGTVESIVESLNTISTKVDFESVTHLFDGQDETLEKIKKGYTMESERLIHDELFENSVDDARSDMELDENDVELF